jgi:hypothetical protein
LKKILVPLITCVISLALLRCLYVARFDGPYSGMVIDRDTRAPIEGAVVIAIWNTESPKQGGAVSQYFDAREAATDKKGEFTIPGYELRIMDTLLPTEILIFKAGYEHFGEVSWDFIRTVHNPEVEWVHEKPRFVLTRMNMQERGDPSTVPQRPRVPENNMKILTQEIDKERIFRGLPPIDLRGAAKSRPQN